MNTTYKQDELHIVGDWNAKDGDIDKDVVGLRSLGNKNETNYLPTSADHIAR